MPPPGPHFIILLIFPLTTVAYSTGAPEQVCKNLQPGEKMTSIAIALQHDLRTWF